MKEELKLFNDYKGPLNGYFFKHLYKSYHQEEEYKSKWYIVLKYCKEKEYKSKG